MAATKVRIGSVSFINAKPLIYGLDRDPGIELHLDIPARLLDGLREKRYDVALLPVIDFQRLEGLRIIPSGCIGCDGPTLTVRIFSRVPIEQIHTLACDTDSHTSVVLARVILARQYGIRPEFVGRDRAGNPRPEAQLLIGDKVIAEEPEGYPHQLDLGEAWKRMTGLPFVFAVWMANAAAEIGDLPAKLQNAKRQGLRHVDEVVSDYAPKHGWPSDIARRYMTEYLKYDVGERQLEAIRRFHQYAAEEGAIPSPVRPLRLG
jgi:chorismate dehydratase